MRESARPTLSDWRVLSKAIGETTVALSREVHTASREENASSKRQSSSSTLSKNE
jgi:hypothetical protein